MKKNKILRIINFELLLIFVLLLIIIQKFDFFKNGYLITKNNIYYRSQNISYDFCQNNSSGYVFYIKKKFGLKEKPTIINYNIEPGQNWIFKKDNIFKESKNIILLNYVRNISYNFKKDKKLGYWVSYDMASPNTTLGGHSLEFIGNFKNKKNNYKISFYKKEVAVLTNIKDLNFELTKNLNDYSKLGEIYFNFNDKKNIHLLTENKINFNDHDSLKIIKFDNEFDDSKIQEVKLHLNQRVDFSNYQILDNYKNKCMYLSLND